MKHFDATRSARALAIALTALGLAVLATEADAQAAEAPAPIAAPAEIVQPPMTAAPSPFGAATAVSAQRLTGSRGGAAVTTQVDIGGVLKDASATNVATGNNAIRDGSFANAVGFNTVIQNSGANVLIQNSMTVNVQFK